MLKNDAYQWCNDDQRQEFRRPKNCPGGIFDQNAVSLSSEDACNKLQRNHLNIC